ncbi:thiamine pyrophosphate-dependent enzyme [Microbacterium sp.]
MMLGELITITQNKLPVKTIVVNNSSAQLRRAGDEGGEKLRHLRH